MTDPRVRRREAKLDAILSAAWDLAVEGGLASISLRDLAGRVELRQPSLYVYFDSKNHLYDAMFADGNRELLDRMAALTLPADPVAALKLVAREMAEFCLENPTRHQLLFRRTIPGFEPSPDSYALAQQYLAFYIDRLRAAGVTQDRHIDVFVALQAGLMDAQLANEPTTRRWIQHMDWAIDMILNEVKRERRNRRRNA